MSGETGLDPAAHALSVFRMLPSGEGRAYTAVTFPQDPWRGCERFVRTCLALGWVRHAGWERDPYGVLDVLDEDGDIVQDYAIPSAKAFQRIKCKLDLRVESTDGEEVPA